MNLPLAGAAACTLGPEELHERLAAWEAALAGGSRHTTSDGGRIVELPGDEQLRQTIEALIAAEGACCPHLRFSLTESGERLRLEISAA